MVVTFLLIERVDIMYVARGEVRNTSGVVAVYGTGETEDLARAHLFDVARCYYPFNDLENVRVKTFSEAWSEYDD